jgi:3-hydroxyacyl-CoA dehydrogenase
MKLVEVIPGVRTSDTTVQIAIALGIRLGKLAVQVEECPSFLVNRLLSRYLNESLWLTQEKKASVEEIDEAACQLLMPVGPLALRDMNGLDIGLAVARFNFQEYGERFRPPPILEKMVQANMLGRKTLAGFYTYDGQTRKATSVNPDFLSLLNSINPDRVGQITESDSLRLFLPMINEAFIALQEKICFPEDLDPALKAGLGMRKGPLELAFEIGLANCLKQIEQLFEQHGERFRPAQLLKRFVWAGKTSLN